MEKKRFIFDLDGTLLQGNFSRENEFFKSCLPEEQVESFLENKYSLLMKYEASHFNYDIEELSHFLSKESGITVSPHIIKEWISINENMDDVVEPFTHETLEYLKSRDRQLIVLTNWFSKTQISRLKNAYLLDYFDSVYGGEFCLKPNKDSFINACCSYSPNQCIMIGDDLEKDVYGALSIGMDALYYNPNGRNDSSKSKVKSIGSLKMIKEMF